MRIIKPYHEIIDPITLHKKTEIEGAIRVIENCAGFDDTTTSVGESFALIRACLMDGDAIIRKIESCGRTCYKSEDKITEESAYKFVTGIMKSGHHSVIEHVNITVRFVCDRGISHELVRHRLASYSQESSRYCNYSKDKFDNQITVILPVGFDERLADTEYPYGFINSMDFHVYQSITETEQEDWLLACEYAEARYFSMIKRGTKPEIARSVLPNSLKTEIVMTCNLREWKHVFRMRCQKAAHPQIRELMLPLLKELHEKIPVVFDEEFEMFFWTKPELDNAKEWAKEKLGNLNIEFGGEMCQREQQ